MAIFSISSSLVQAQAQLQGAWKLTTPEGSSHLLILSGDYFSWTEYAAKDGAFISTQGGKWAKTGKNLTLTYEFHTADKEKVGTSKSLKLVHVPKKQIIKLKGKGVLKGNWTDVDQGKTTPLTGAWLISGRKRNGEIGKINTNRPRKTMKILSGTQFQWIAYNTETKEFFGTGGGAYTADGGKYVENIGFFSRDNSRVGASLSFDFAVEEGDWIHSGKSSKGAPLYEIWSKRK
ncbi:MAG: membrane or secreted protein [Saprospiraceae bacterium]|nr:membrane or secreted protein [Saprospiraceae bacterium]